MRKILPIVLAFVMLMYTILPTNAYTQYDDNNQAIIDNPFDVITIKDFLHSIIEIMYIDNTQFDVSTLNPEDILNIAVSNGLVSEGHYNTDNLESYISKRDAELIFIRAINNKSYISNINDSISKLTSLDLDNPTTKLIIDMYNKVNQPIQELNGFYAISSYAQIDFIPSFDSVSFGWSELKYNKSRNTVELTLDGSSFSLPSGFSEPINLAQENKVSTNLMVFASQGTKLDNGKGIIEQVITDPRNKKQVIKQIVNKTKSTVKSGKKISFDGVVIDFEDIKEERLASYYNDFLKLLQEELSKDDKKLYVAVHPRKYYKGYDYKTIGEIADKVILMAHDFYVRDVNQLNVADPYNDFNNINTPLAPLENSYDISFDIYSALEDITNEENGIADKNKIVLQLSFDAVQWIKDLNTNSVRRSNPNYQQIKNRLDISQGKDPVVMNYDKISESPYFYYYNSQNNTENIVWYEDSRSIQSKIYLAKLFGINNISLWRIGNIPDFPIAEDSTEYLDIWDNIIKQKPIENLIAN